MQAKPALEYRNEQSYETCQKHNIILVHMLQPWN